MRISDRPHTQGWLVTGENSWTQVTIIKGGKTNTWNTQRSQHTDKTEKDKEVRTKGTLTKCEQYQLNPSRDQKSNRNQEMETMTICLCQWKSFIIYSNHSRRWSLGEWLQQSLKTYNLALTTGKLAQCFRIADMGVLFWKEFAHGVGFHCCAAIWVQYVHSHFHTCSLKQWLTLRELLLHVMLPMAGDPLGCHHPWKEWEH